MNLLEKAFSLFGVTPSSIDDMKKTNKIPIVPDFDDGALTYGVGGGLYVHSIADVFSTLDQDKKLINEYRRISGMAEVGQAIQEVVGDAIVYSPTEIFPMRIDLDELELPESVKKKIITNFEKILSLGSFNRSADIRFAEWYRDGRLGCYLDYEDEDSLNEAEDKLASRKSQGIQNIIFIDATELIKIRELDTELKNGVEVISGINEFYLYVPSEFDMNTKFSGHSIDTFRYSGMLYTGIKLDKDFVVYSTSGLTDNSKATISHLHDSIKPANNLDSIEESTIIHRVSRAPSRRAIYVDTGNLPPQKGEAYIDSLIAKFKNKISYDSSSGKIQSSSPMKSILEDFWLPRSGTGKSTEIQTLEGSASFNSIVDELAYFRNKLYESLHVPKTRFNSESTWTLGVNSEITREEVKFSKFINRLRVRFSTTFLVPLLKIECILTGVCNEEEWEKIHDKIQIIFNEDNHFAKMKELEVEKSRLDMIEKIDPYIGKYYSRDFVFNSVLEMTDEERDVRIKKMKDEIDSEQINDPLEKERYEYGAETSATDNDGDYK